MRLNFQAGCWRVLLGQPLIVKRLNSLQFSRPPPKRNIF